MNAPPTVAVLLPVHDKPEEVIAAVLERAASHSFDEAVIVYDRCAPKLTQFCREFLDEMDDCGNLATVQQEIVLDGRPGWRSPCIAANAGLARITADITIYNPSDVVQAPGNIDKVRAHFAAYPNSVLYGRVTESNPELCKGQGHAGPVLQGTDNTRFMTFLTAYPTAILKQIGGWDEAFQLGVCYEDDDLAARLWKAGLDFVIDDSFSGVHQSHVRAFDGNNASQGYWTDYRVGLNRTLMVNKHGRDRVYNVVMQDKPLMLSEPGRMIWKHVSPKA